MESHGARKPRVFANYMFRCETLIPLYIWGPRSAKAVGRGGSESSVRAVGGRFRIDGLPDGEHTPLSFGFHGKPSPD